MQKVLIWFAYLLVILGIFFISWSFRRPNRKNSKRKLIRIGGFGVIMALIGGLIFICYYYARQPVSERIIKEHLEKNYPDKPSDVSMQKDLNKIGIT